MRFKNSRGRPRLNRPQIDKGTKELQEKKRKGITNEPIDVCFQRGLISAEQHWSALHFRWLHTLRFGITTVRALDPANIGGIDHVPASDEYRERNEREYNIALEKLSAAGCDKIIIDLCIYNLWPNYLRFRDKKYYTLQDEKDLKKLKRSLSILFKLWRGEDPSKKHGNRKRVA